MIVYGLELGFVAVAAVCSLIAVLTWIQSSHVGYALSLYSLIKRAHDRNDQEVALRTPPASGNAVPITAARSRRRRINS